MSLSLSEKWNRFVWGDSVAGVHAHISEDGSMVFKWVTAKIKGDQVRITSQSGPSLEVPDKEIPVQLVVTGRGVLTRRVARTHGGEETQAEQILSEFGANRPAFSVSAQGDVLYLSMLRKEVLSSVVDVLKQMGHEVIGAEIGVPSVWVLLQSISGPTAVNTGDFVIQFDSSCINTIDSQPSSERTTYEIDGENVSGEHLIPFASTLHFFAEQQPISALVPEREEGFYQRAIRKAGILGIGAVFLLLLINAIGFMHLHENRNALSSSLEVYRDRLDEHRLMTAEIDRQKELMTISGSMVNGRCAEILDAIGQGVPENVVLSQLTINPLLPRKTEAERITVSSGLVVIGGVCLASDDLTSWITGLKGTGLFKEVTISKFSRKESLQMNEFLVEAKLILDGN